jgi:peroxiredoxin
VAKKLEQLAAAPDFELKDTQGNRVKLSEVYRRQPVVLVMNRGFM